MIGRIGNGARREGTLIQLEHYEIEKLRANESER